MSKNTKESINTLQQFIERMSKEEFIKFLF